MESLKRQVEMLSEARDSLERDRDRAVSAKSIAETELAQEVQSLRVAVCGPSIISMCMPVRLSQTRRVDDLERRIAEARAEASRTAAIAAERSQQWQTAVTEAEGCVYVPSCADGRAWRSRSLHCGVLAGYAPRCRR